jgi:hypothetical protein
LLASIIESLKQATSPPHIAALEFRRDSLMRKLGMMQQ